VVGILNVTPCSFVDHYPSFGVVFFPHIEVRLFLQIIGVARFHGVKNTDDTVCYFLVNCRSDLELHVRNLICSADI
jgi:hypothetical protein